MSFSKLIDAGILVQQLTAVFNASLSLASYYPPWKVFTTIVLRKPRKPDYTKPKAYRPVALISCMAKVLSACIAEDLSAMVESHHMLPRTHFGGRPGRTTTDQLHHIVSRVKDAWREGKVATVLYLDVAGAFPNAVRERLIHNLKARGVPDGYVRFVDMMLADRFTQMRFDDYVSDLIAITNGIGQGCPLSMLLYLFYNADICDIPVHEYEDATCFVDDASLLAIGKTFLETHKRIASMMSRRGGATEWSKAHNSPWELEKSEHVDYTRNNRLAQSPPLRIRGVTIRKATSHKQVGVYLDEQLRWKEQEIYAAAKASKWVGKLRSLARGNSGIPSRYVRQLYQVVGVAQFRYASDVWYTTPYLPAVPRRRGDQSAQRPSSRRYSAWRHAPSRAR